MLKFFLLWFPMLLLAIGNGAARDLWYKKYTGEPAAHQISTISLMVLFGIYTWIVIKSFTARSSAHALYIGLFWLALTLLFEFGFGLARGNTLSKLLRDYNLHEGRIWVLIPIWVAVAPYLFYRIQHK